MNQTVFLIVTYSMKKNQLYVFENCIYLVN